MQSDLSNVENSLKTKFEIDLRKKLDIELKNVEDSVKKSLETDLKNEAKIKIELEISKLKSEFENYIDKIKKLEDDSKRIETSMQIAEDFIKKKLEKDLKNYANDVLLDEVKIEIEQEKSKIESELNKHFESTISKLKKLEDDDINLEINLKKLEGDIKNQVDNSKKLEAELRILIDNTQKDIVKKHNDDLNKTFIRLQDETQTTINSMQRQIKENYVIDKNNMDSKMIILESSFKTFFDETSVKIKKLEDIIPKVSQLDLDAFKNDFQNQIENEVRNGLSAVHADMQKIVNESFETIAKDFREHMIQASRRFVSLEARISRLNG